MHKKEDNIWEENEKINRATNPPAYNRKSLKSKYTYQCPYCKGLFTNKEASGYGHIANTNTTYRFNQLDFPSM